MSKLFKKQGSAGVFVVIIVVTALITVGVVALLTNIFERKAEGKNRYVRLVEVTEDTTDPAVWGKNWPKQYDSYQRTALPTKTKYGGHGGNEALPAQKIERPEYHWLKRMFLGYAFSIDYRDRRGHAYMLADQEATDRMNVQQWGSCMHCHASIMPVYRKLGDGDAIEGLNKTHSMKYEELNKMVHDMGHGHPVSCVDCHDPESMSVRVTRPGLLVGLQRLAAGDAPVPALPSIEIWRQGARNEPYDPNVDATRNEMRSLVCGQCHVEYYCSKDFPLTFPWSNGLKMENEEQEWDETKLPNGDRFYDYKHKETGAPILKTQHPEFELWAQGIHARNGVSCSDCHMPYIREGASKISDHWVRSPLLNVNRACQTCHHSSEAEILERVEIIQDTNYKLLLQGGEALDDLMDAIMAAKEAGATPGQLNEALEFQRKAQWRLDYIAAENSMGFHAPQEAARILAEAADLARQGQVSALLLMQK